MSNTKSTKHAWLFSLTAMLLCVALLIGTTFAWFTDTASTAVNKIQAGKLDIALEMKNAGGNWVNAEGETLGWVAADGRAQDKILWEPGCTYQLPELRIVNKGNLALKYRIVVNGIVGNAKLLEVISFTYGNGININDEVALAPNAATEGIIIKGHMKEEAGNEYQGLSIDGIGITVVATQYTYEYDSTTNQYDKDAPLQVNAKGVGDIPVTNDSTTNNATVSTEKTISGGDMAVTYPAGVMLGNTGAVTGNTDKKTTVEQKFEYKGDTPSVAMSGISIDDGKAIASYELTLPVSASNNTPVTVTIKYSAGLTGVQVYHSGTLLTSTANANGESATYDASTGVLTLKLMHASPIDIVYNAVLPANANLVYTLDELEAAVGNLHDGDYILFGANIVQDKVDTTSGQITFARASDAEGDIEATLDLNGYVFDGQIGGFSFANDGITVNVIGTEKVAAEYYEHQTGHHMVKACAVFNYSGNTVLKSGLFESNNIVVMAYGGNVVVEGGDIHNTDAGSCGIYACNDPKITVNGGNFSCEEGGAIFVIEPYRTDRGPVITINGGTFDASKGACFLCVDGGSRDAGEVAQVVINGGTFTMPSDPDWAQDDDGVLANGSNRLVIRGGTFNLDPSAYVPEGYVAHANANGTWTVSAK